MSRTFAAIAALTFILASSAASAQLLKTADTPKGKTFVDAKGMTLYTFDKDEPGKSNCTGQCAEYWPPLMASAADKAVGGLTIIKRADGSMQWADDGKPLYTFASDKKSGDATGDNKNNVWHVVKEK
jgi:predicted lipoprotein with Yx(FWY)xxD motif